MMLYKRYCYGFLRTTLRSSLRFYRDHIFVMLIPRQKGAVSLLSTWCVIFVSVKAPAGLWTRGSWEKGFLHPQCNKLLWAAYSHATSIYMSSVQSLLFVGSMWLRMQSLTVSVRGTTERLALAECFCMWNDCNYSIILSNHLFYVLFVAL